MSERLYRQNKRLREARKRKIRIYSKAVLVLCGFFLLFWLIGRTGIRIYRQYEENTYISQQEAVNLTQILLHTARSFQKQNQENTKDSADWMKNAQEGLEEYIETLDAAKFGENLTWKQAKILSLLLGEENREWLKNNEKKDGDFVKAKVWMEWYEAVYQKYDPSGFGAQWEERTLSNIWVEQYEDGKLSCFYRGYEAVFLAADIKPEPIKEVIADLCFEGGNICDLNLKQEKVSGRLLLINGEGIELEQTGYFPVSDDLQIYRLYGNMEMLSLKDLRIGYNFADFVIEDGVIEAALVVREEKMENIRVLIKSSDYEKILHEELKLSADCRCQILSLGTDSSQKRVLEAGEVLEINAESDLFAHADRVRIEPEILTGRMTLLNVKRSVKNPAYRGSLELVRTKDGIYVINELLLEEYLYAVVPSEMPSSYPKEALKSQAICARTYAYEKIPKAGLPDYGAHVDDSTSFQVYNNIGENPQTTDAVKATDGQIICYQDAPAEVYYYSTSCGYGTNADVWQDGNAEKYPYLVSQKIGNDNIFYEQEEPWYRWSYAAEQIDMETLNERIQKRWEANAFAVLTKQPDGSFVSEKPEKTGKIKEISIADKNDAGAADSLLIEGENTTLLVRKEYNIRTVLCDGKTQVLRQDGSLVNASGLLPSAFFTLETVKERDYVVGYKLSGGGFGHGVGLSQNAAKQMAAAGVCAEDIVEFFFSGCSVNRIN